MIGNMALMGTVAPEFFPFAVKMVALFVIPLCLGLYLFNRFMMYSPRVANAAMREAMSEPVPLVMRTIMVHGAIQCPAAILIKDGLIRFVPLLGKPVEVPLSKVVGIELTNWFNRIWYPRRVGLWLERPGETRLGFLVGDPAPWIEAIENEGETEGGPMDEPPSAEDAGRI